MDIRQQITISSDEVQEIIESHLKEKGYDIKSGSFSKNNSYFGILFTEEESWFKKTKELLSKPIDFFDFKEQSELFKKLKHSSLKNLGDLLELKFPRDLGYEETLLEFKSENMLQSNLFEFEREISKEEETFLINEFKKNDIHVRKRK
jgi:hypothetical protein